jgi:hypothetical protein
MKEVWPVLNGKEEAGAGGRRGLDNILEVGGVQT